MQLHYAPYSPYARKVRVVASEHDHTLELIDTDTWSVPGSLYHVNPPGKVPAQNVQRWPSLRLQALGDGIMEAAVTAFVEASRPSETWGLGWRQRQLDAIHCSLAALDTHPNELEDFSIGTVSVAVSISYLLFRLGAINWLGDRGALGRWYEHIERRSSLAATRLHDRESGLG